MAKLQYIVRILMFLVLLSFLPGTQGLFTFQIVDPMVDHIKDKDTIAFEIQLPQNAKRSFNANHSEYYWLLEAKVDIDAKRDIRINKLIQVA